MGAARTHVDAAAAITALQAAWQRTYGGDAIADLPPALRPLQPARRGGTDALAAWRRWHPPALDARFGPAEWPWYAVLERARVETLASRDLPGMALNLSDLAGLEPTDRRAARLHRLARRILAAPLEADAEEAEGDGAERSARDGRVTGLAAESPVVASPSGGLRALVRLWQRRALPVTAEAAGPSDARIVRVLDQARSCLADAAAFAEQVFPLVRELTLAATTDATPPRPNSPPLREETQDDGPPIPDEEVESDPAQAGDEQISPIDRRYPDYAIYSNHWDRTQAAARLCAPGDAMNPQGLDDSDRRRAYRLAQQLQRKLLTARLRRWSFDRDEGRLDSRRLSRLLTSKSPYAVFRQEDETPIPEACVTLLVDQSGSMRGLPQRLTAQAIDLAAQALDRCQVKCEVLGYTTRYGADNPLVRAWHAAGRPPNPGRLNALRHIVYKRADQPWRRARPSLGLLLREGFGRENLDGEALDWAARRLLRRPEPRKILIVLCDGAPFDEATVAANGRRFLEDHLRAVIAALETSPIHLAAIGAGQTVGRYYRHALTLRRPDEVAEVLFDHLGDLLTQAYP